MLHYLCSTELGDEMEFDEGHKEDSEGLSEETSETEMPLSVADTPKVSCANAFAVTTEALEHFVTNRVRSTTGSLCFQLCA